MAYDYNKLILVQQNFTQGLVNLWTYTSTTDTLNTIEASGYFAPAAVPSNSTEDLTPEIRVQDFINISASNGVDIVAVSGLAPITVASVVSDAGAALTNGDVWIGNASNLPVANALSGAITMTNTGVTSLTAGTVTNAGVNAAAAIAYSKLAALPSAEILVGSAGNIPTAVAVTGVVAISNTGVTSLTAGSVLLAALGTGIAPAAVAKFSGKITWSGSGATLATTIAGVAATDVVQVCFQNVPTQASTFLQGVPTTNTITLTLSTANTSNDAVIAYTVFRAAS